jgi:hypothetical protein
MKKNRNPQIVWLPIHQRQTGKLKPLKIIEYAQSRFARKEPFTSRRRHAGGNYKAGKGFLCYADSLVQFVLDLRIPLQSIPFRFHKTAPQNEMFVNFL